MLVISDAHNRAAKSVPVIASAAPHHTAPRCAALSSKIGLFTIVFADEVAWLLCVCRDARMDGRTEEWSSDASHTVARPRMLSTRFVDKCGNHMRRRYAKRTIKARTFLTTGS